MVDCIKGDYYNNARRVYQKHYNIKLDPKIYVCHTCDHNWCIEITHLFTGTQQDNMEDMMKKGRGTAKLSDDHIRKIRGMKEEHSVRELAHLFGVSRETISNILRGEIYKWVK